MATGIVNPYSVAAAGGLSYEGECLADNPVGLWMMDETSGTTVVNQGSSGTAGNGSYPSLYSPSLAGDTLFGLTTPLFHAKTDQALVTYPAGYTPDAGLTGAATWEVLFRLDAASFSSVTYLFSYGPAPYKPVYIYVLTNGLMQIFILTSTGYSVTSTSLPSGSIVAGTEYHFVMTYDRAAQRVEVWLNGVSAAVSTAFPGGRTTGAGPLTQTIGNFLPGASTGGVTGSMGGYAMYPGVLSNARIAAHYAAL